jgi:hypothetical protein
LVRLAKVHSALTKRANTLLPMQSPTPNPLHLDNFRPKSKRWLPTALRKQHSSLVKMWIQALHIGDNDNNFFNNYKSKEDIGRALSCEEIFKDDFEDNQEDADPNVGLKDLLYSHPSYNSSLSLLMREEKRENNEDGIRKKKKKR